MKTVVIGGGIVGLATALELRRLDPRREIVVLEKEPGVGRHQSTHNSGVLHAGTYYKPGSLKARLAVEGIRRMTAFCREHGIAHEICGKLIVATTPEEEARLDGLLDRAQRNGLQGVRRVGPEEIREREPHAAGRAALLVPEEGIVDYDGVCRTMAALLAAEGVEIRTGTRVTGLRGNGTARVLETTGGDLEAGMVVGCAGLHSDRVARACGARTGRGSSPSGVNTTSCGTPCGIW